MTSWVHRTVTVAALGAAACSGQVPAERDLAPAPSAFDYWVYVANESSDKVSRVRFGPRGATEEHTVDVGIMPADLDGAHGLTVSPSGDHWYVSIAHGQPYGQVWKFDAATNQFLDSTTVGLFPATMALTPDGSTLFVVNFNLHGDPVPSSVSAVFTPFMSEIKQITTCVMPHGSKINRVGTRHYSTCMMGDQLVEIATDRLVVTRRLSLTLDQEKLLGDDAADRLVTGEAACKPTWVTISPDDEHLYVPCNGRAEVLEIDANAFEVTRRFPTGKAPYNADVSADGRYLVVSLKGAQSVAVIDLRDGAETQIATSQPITHGVVISPDSRYAFISNESIGATRGTIDVIDVVDKRRVGTATVQHQPGGIGFWKMKPAESPTRPLN